MSVQFRLVHYLGILFVLHGIAVCGLCRSVQATEKDGLPESGKAEIADTEIAEAEIVDGDREHWSFQPIAQPLAPEVQSRSRLRSPIDSFVLAQLETQGLTFAPQAEPAVLLRRLKLDLVGLPPSPQELDAFLSDDRRDRYENWVDQYLASPQFAERQAQSWLDLARFAETDGFEHDRLRPQAWQYRDWVIRALNQDMPYDRFIELQLAGDLHVASTPEAGIATMFCLAGADMPDINEQDVRRHDRLNEMTSMVGSVLLGLQMHCAQCHDHKYDPISQADFYRLRAVFETSVPLLERDRPFNFFDAQPSSQTPRFYYRGDLHSPGTRLAPAVPRIAVLPGADGQLAEDQPRQALADWLFREDNPLTARVIVNRIWQQHFGRSLFGNPSDVGVVAAGPTHPELLDWLAGYLRDHQWSLKALHRQILLSATYQQSSMLDAESPDATPPERSAQATAWQDRLQRDPHNQLYSRFPRQRLDGEVIRDSLLSVAGLLNGQAAGPSVMPDLPSELRSTLLKGQWSASADMADHYRRSIYVFARRNLRYPIFDVFDRPDAGASCPQRVRSTTALQALHLLNSELTIHCAKMLSQRVSTEVAAQRSALGRTSYFASPWAARRLSMKSAVSNPSPPATAVAFQLAWQFSIPMNSCTWIEPAIRLGLSHLA